MNKKQVFGMIWLLSLMIMATIGCFTLVIANGTSAAENRQVSNVSTEYPMKAAPRIMAENETATEAAEWQSKGWIGVGAGLAIGLAGLGAAIGMDTGS